MATLTPDQVRKLLAAGVPQSTINAYQRNGLNPISGSSQRIKNILQPANTPTVGGKPSSQGNIFTSIFNKKFPSTPQPTSRALSAGIFGLGPAANAVGLGRGFGPPPVKIPSPPIKIPSPGVYNGPFANFPPGQVGVGSYGPPTSKGVPYKTPPVTYKGPTDPGVFGPGIPNKKGGDKTDAERQAEDEALDRQPTRQAELPPLPGAPAAPVYPELTLPELVIRDFLEQAKAQYASAYAPLYQAVEQGKTNATNNQQRSDAVIEGLYGGLASDIANSGQQQAQQYQQSGQQAQATAQALQDKIGEIYNGSNSQEANLAASLGQGQAGAELIAGNAGERQFQQAEAATQGTAQQNSYQQGAQAAQDYSTQMGNAARSEGAGRRSDLIAQLGNVLSGLDTQALGYKSQEAIGALGQANTLSERDLNQQQTRINQLLQEAGIEDNRINSQYSAAQQAYADQIAARNAELARLDAIKAEAAAAAQQRRENEWKERQVRVAESSIPNPNEVDPEYFPTSPTGKFEDLPARDKVVAKAEAIDRGKGTEYAKMFEDMMNGVDPNTYGNVQTFGEHAANWADKNGLNRDVARSVSQDFWRLVMGRT